MAIQDDLPQSRITLKYRTTINGAEEDISLPLKCFTFAPTGGGGKNSSRSRSLTAALALVALQACSAGSENATRATEPLVTTSGQVETSDPAQITVFYPSSDQDFANPERGLFHMWEVFTWGDLTKEITPQGSVIPVEYFDWKGQRDGAFFENLKSIYREYRENEHVTLVKLNINLDAFVPSYFGLTAIPGCDSENRMETLHGEGYPNIVTYDRKNIGGEYLQLIESHLNAIQEAGIKAVVRIVYTNKRLCPPYEDADLPEIDQHLDQLRVTFQTHSQVIALVEAGIIGNFGEWAYTDHFGNPNDPLDITRANYDKRRALVSKVLELFPAKVIQLRTPSYKYQMYDESYRQSTPVLYDSSNTTYPAQPTPLNQVSAFSDDGARTEKGRIGHHNDCFLSTSNDAGTYGVYLPVEDDKRYLAEDTKFVPMGGEVCNVDFAAYPPEKSPNGRFSCPTALSELQRFHWSYLNAITGDGRNTVGDIWDNGQMRCLPEVKRRLGYRFALVEGRYSDAVAVGGKLAINIQLRNEAWAAPFNRRPVKLVLRDRVSGSAHEFDLNGVDPRLWLPDGSGIHSIRQEVEIPGNLPPGDYDLLLHLPDADSALSLRPEYSIRFANGLVWEPLTGYNKLLHTVTVYHPELCGNGTCDAYETSGTCKVDCGPASPSDAPWYADTTSRASVVSLGNDPAQAYCPYREGQGGSNALAGWLDNGDSQLVGDFLGRGHDQVTYFNRQGDGNRMAIVDYAGQSPPGDWTGYVEGSQSYALSGWLDDGDSQLAGDFLGRGHDQVMYFNRQGAGNRMAIVDYAGQSPPGDWTGYVEGSQSNALSGWLDDGDSQLAGDFLGRGHDQVMYFNRQEAGNRMAIVDYAGKSPPGDWSAYVEDAQSNALSGWLDDGDVQLVGDFLGLGHDQVMYINRQWSQNAGRVAIVDYAGQRPPGKWTYLERWDDSYTLNGWLDDGDSQLAGDFLGRGHDQVMYFNRQQGPGRVMILDYAQATVPGDMVYWESSARTPDGWGGGGKIFVGNFAGPPFATPGDQLRQRLFFVSGP